jgi:two-component system OmpR family response regulator
MDIDAATPPAPNLLLVEDDQDLRAEMAAYLSANGYAVHEAGDAVEARQILRDGSVHLVVLDVNLPGEDGLSLCRTLTDNRGPPILMLSAMGESVDRILGLELGADDYVVKPITPRELLARVKALLRRRPPVANANDTAGYAFAGFRLDLAARQLRAPNGMILLLTRGELAILTALLARPRTVVSREDLLTLVRGEAPDVVGRGVDLHISRLRRKIQDQTSQEIIRTQRGVGYMLDAKVTQE